MDELQKALETLFGYDRTDIDKMEMEYRQRKTTAPRQVEKIAKLSGLDAVEIIRHAYEASWHTGLKWYEVLGVLQAFYVGIERDKK